MKNRFILLLLSFTLALPSLLSAQELRKEVTWQDMDGVTVPIPPQTHPRLYLRASDIPALKERLKTPQAQETLAALKEIGKDRTPEEEAAETNHAYRYYHKMRGVTSRAQLQALDYLVNGNKRQARRAITAMLDTLRTTRYGTQGDLSRASGAMLMVGAMVYDWCYDQMKESEKQAYIREFVRIAGTMECGYPPQDSQPFPATFPDGKNGLPPFAALITLCNFVCRRHEAESAVRSGVSPCCRNSLRH